MPWHSSARAAWCWRCYPRESLAAGAGLPGAGSGFGGIALADNIASREQVDRVLAEVVAAGATLLRPAHEAEWGGYSGYCADPDGYPWEVAWNPGFPLDADGRVVLPA